MSLQDLELSPFLISELYKDALVTVNSGEVIEEPPARIKTKQPEDLGGYLPADTASLGLPPVTAKPKAATEAPEFQKPAIEKPQAQPQPSVQQQPASSTTLKYLGGNKKKT